MTRIRPVIVTEKHILPQTLFNIAAGAIQVVNLVESVVVASKDAPIEVEEGSVISSIYVEMWVITNGSGIGSGLLTLEKVPGTSADMIFSQSVNLNVYANKKNILYTTQGISAGNGGNPIPFLRGWFKIPKGKQRFGLGDKLNLNISSISGGWSICGIAIFKEQK